MKPLRLYMKNIGPFRDETIDFTLLDNMFLIKGDTGAGKTFIFDALTFALYGKVRGNRSNHEHDLKSRYAPEEEESFVEFDFEIAGEKYRINRTVPFWYTNRNGKVSNKQSEASLSVWRGSSAKDAAPELFESSWELLPCRLKGEVDAKVQELLGLSADEFAKIVVLPQGEFAEFLHQNSKERAETLKKLFPVSFYSNITQRFKEKADKAHDELKTLSLTIQGLSSDKDFSAADETISRMTDELLKAKADEKRAVEKRNEISALSERLKNEKAAAREYEENLRKKDALELQADAMKALSDEIEAAARAVTLREFISTRDNTAARLSQSRAAAASAEKERDTLQKSFDALEAEKDAMQELKVRSDEDGKALSVIQKQLENAAGLGELKESAALAREKKTQAEEKKRELSDEQDALKKELGDDGGLTRLEKLTSSLEEDKRMLSSLEDEAENAEKRDGLAEKKALTQNALAEAQDDLKAEEAKLEATKQTIQALEDEKKKAETQHQAWSLAQFLDEGKPCPVCGSLTHPHMAEKPEGVLSDDSQIALNKGNAESIAKLMDALKSSVTQKETELKGFDALLSEIETQRPLAQIQDELSSLRKTAADLEKEKADVTSRMHQLTGVKDSLDAASAALTEADAAFVKLSAQIESIEASLGEPLEVLRSRETALKDAITENRARHDAWRASYDDAAARLAEIKTTAAKYAEDVVSLTAELEKAEAALAEKVAAASFPSVEAAVKAHLADSVLAQKKAEHAAWKEALAAVNAAVEAAERKHLRAVSDVEADEAQAAEQAAGIAELYEEAKAAAEKLGGELASYRDAYEKVRDAQDKKLALEEKVKPLSALSEALLGKNPQKLAFETWALGMYFQQVVEFASRRFNDISDGRFSFQLKQPDEQSTGNSQRGLDLLVLDSYTGKTSDAAELSGGETFEASISLALAITDVVQNDNGGGIQLDSLFIDEGFGTLDPETLEKAMSVLMELGETRMIGMISHVSEMESFPGITSAISVQKGRQGSHVTTE